MDKLPIEDELMDLKELSIFEIKPGHVVAENVTNHMGVALIAKDTIMNEYIRKKLLNMGVESIFVYDPDDGPQKDDLSYLKYKRNYRMAVFQTKDMVTDLVAGRPLEYQKLSKISGQIHKNINENHNIIRYMKEMHDSDEYTYNHSVKVAIYSMLIGKWLGLTKGGINGLIQSALLHDIGKTKIPSEILNKRGVLTKEEFEIIKEHAELGYEMIENIKELSYDVKSGVLLHHERIDGSGYPLNLSDKGINFYAKVLAVADVFDAMTSDRPYKKRMPPFQVFKMFQTVGIGLFDYKIMKTFLSNLSIYLIGSKVLLSNGEIGEIVYIPLQNPSNPIVESSLGYLDIAKEDKIKILEMK